jgi:hypothetical protein
VTAGYSGTPLPKKLGIRDGTRLALLNAPEKFSETLGELPQGVVVKRRLGGEADVIVLFVMQFSKLKSDFGEAANCLPPAGGMLWVAWPKKAAKMDTDLSENLIRDFGLAAGLVDTKVCAIDEKWSGLRFSRRRSS